MIASEIDSLLRDNLPRLRRFALWLCHEQMAADDLVRLTIARAQGKHHLNHYYSSSLVTHLYRSMYHLFEDRMQRPRNWWLLGRKKDIAGAQFSVASASANERSNLNFPVMQAFERLPQEQRVLLFLVVVEGFSYQDTANIFQVPLTTIIGRLTRARNALGLLNEGESPRPALRVMK